MKWLRRVFFDNVGWKLLSLVIAVLLWVLVASEPELTMVASVPLEYRNLPGDIEISSEPVSTISLELRGPSGELRGESGPRPSVIIDMTGVQPGEQTFPIGDENVRLPRGVRLVRAIPSEVRLDFDRRITRDVPVVVRITGDGAHGYMVIHKSADPPELKIIGPANRVERVNAAVTDPVDVAGAVGTVKYQVNAYIQDPYVRFKSSPRVTVTVTMAKE